MSYTFWMLLPKGTGTLLKCPPPFMQILTHPDNANPCLRTLVTASSVAEDHVSLVLENVGIEEARQKKKKKMGEALGP